MTTWTPAQYSAIHHKDKNITVSASAGSGKTTILVERILTRIIQDRIPLDRILAMTFTEAAASEMKKRLFKSLNQAKIEAESMGDDAALAYLNEQLVLLQRAQISTIHSFCLSILQENYALIGFHPQRLQNIISDDFAVAMKKQAMTQTINTWMHDESFALLKQYFSAKPHDQSKLEEQIMFVASILSGMNSTSAFMELIQSLHSVRSMSELPDSIRDSYFIFLLDTCHYIEETLQQMEICYSGEKESNIEQKRQFLLQLQQDAIEQNYAMFHLHFQSYGAVVTATCTDSTRYTKLRAQLHDLDDRLCEILFDESTLLSDLRMQYPLIHLLLSMSLTYRDYYAQIKEQEAVMDFEDMEAKALELLCVNDHEVAKRYQERFIDILVDEYQDSSYHQDTLIQLIQNGRNVFRVGDVKQSIYRFRGAVPDLLRGYIMSDKEEDEVIHLRHNYRSNSQIIHYVNAIFERFMNVPSYPSLFSEEDVAQVGLESQYTQNPSIDLHVLITDALVSTTEETEDEEVLASEELRAMYIANLIIQDKEAKSKKWNDYVILVRNHNRKNSLKRAFEAANIPNFIDSKEGFYNAPVIETMRAFFKTLINPNDNLHFSAVCMSAIYKMSDNDMARMKIDAKSQSFYNYALQSNHPVLRKIVQDINHLSGSITIASLLRKIFQINEFYDTKTTANDRNNLDLLYEKAVLFELKGQKTLHQFIAFIDVLVDSKSSEALSINIEEDVVRVMTIHQSKGLQFDTVIYWGKEQSSKQNAPLIYMHEQLGMGMDYIKLPSRLKRPTLTKMMLEHFDTKEEVSEEIRILYVALTRAKQQLYMITTAKDSQAQELMTSPLTSYQLQRSMRLSHWLISLSAQLPADLVKTTLIYTSFDALQVTRKERSPQIIHRWHPVHQIAVEVSPSQEKPLQLFDWQPKKNQANIGVITHRLIQLMDVKKTYTESELMSLMKAIDSSMVSQIGYRQIMAMQENAIYKKSQTLDVSKEIPFTYQTDEGQVVSGYIDFAAIDHELKSIIIIDFKTDQHTTDIKLIDAYHLQMLTYLQAMNQLYAGYRIECYIYSLWLSKEIFIASNIN